MSKEHTQARLRVPDDGTVGSIETEDGTSIGHTFQVSAHDQGIGSPIRRANARRLVACWNACEGISTENLEDNLPVKSLAKLYNNTINQRDIAWGELREIREAIAANPEESTTDEVRRVMAQQARLQAAAKSAREFINHDRETVIQGCTVDDVFMPDDHSARAIAEYDAILADIDAALPPKPAPAVVHLPSDDTEGGAA